MYCRYGNTFYKPGWGIYPHWVCSLAFRRTKMQEVMIQDDLWQKRSSSVGENEFFRYRSSNLMLTRTVLNLIEKVQITWLLHDIAQYHLERVKILCPRKFYRVTIRSSWFTTLRIQDGCGRTLYKCRSGNFKFRLYSKKIRLCACQWPNHQFCLMVLTEC